MNNKKQRMQVAGVKIPQPKSLDEAMVLDKYLSRLEHEMAKEAIAILFDYLDRDKSLLHGGSLINVKEKISRSRDSFIITTEEDETIKVNPSTLDNLLIQEYGKFHSQGYDTIREIRREILDARAKINQDYTFPKFSFDKDKLKEWALYQWKRFRAKKPDLDLEQAIKDTVEKGFGGKTKSYESRYYRQIKRDLTAGLVGGGLVLSLLYLIFSNEPGRYGSGVDSPTSRTSSYAEAGDHWSPDGIPGGKGGKGKPEQGKKKSSLEELQDQHLGKGDFSEPERLKDILEKYLDLTEDFPVHSKYTRHDMSPPEGHFPPKSLKPYPLSSEGVAVEMPIMDPGDRILMLVLDITGSMKNPENILEGNPSEGYFLAVQFVKSFSDLGAPLRIIKYPVQKVSEESIVQTTSRDAALEALKYKEGGADDSSAVDRVATLYLSAFKDEKPMDVIFITDQRPTVMSSKRFMELEKQYRGKDMIYWINCAPLDSMYERRLETEIDSLNTNEDKRYHYFSVDTIEKAKEIAKEILKGYKR